MSHYDELFPVGISFNSQHSPTYKTEIARTRGGHRTTDAKYTYPLHYYDISYGINTKDTYETVLDWFHAMGGSRHSFLFKDWADFKSVHTDTDIAFDDCSIGTGDGATDDWQALKVYSPNGGASQTRKIDKIVAGQAYAGVNGVEGTEGVDWTLNDSTGVFTFAVTPPNSQDITAGFEFYVPVAFVGDRLDVTLETILAGNAQIILEEVRL